MFFLLMNLAHASGHASTEEISRLVISQAINFFAFVGILGYFLRAKIKAHYATRQKDFLVALEKAELAKKEAEQKNQHIMAKINEINKSQAQTIKFAQEKAASARLEIIEDAKRNAASLKLEAENTYKSQVANMLNRLKADLLINSVESAQGQIRSKMQKQDHENIKDHLVKSFGASK